MWSSCLKMVLIGLLSGGLMTACAVEVKDGEYAVPADGKADSFRSPTEHGVLPFGSQSRARISDEAEFHAWTFSLTGQAEVDINLGASDTNLDTVLYLYHRTDDSERWGRYIRKNDDDGRRLQSRITDSFDEGEYRIVVKGFKEIHRGAFYAEATCDGAGCERRGGTFVAPAETRFTESCNYRLFEALWGSRTFRTSLSVTSETESGFDKEVMIALDHYRDLSDWEEYWDEGDGPYTFDVDVERLTGGTIVTMHDGGDESSTDYVFDSEGELLSYYVHNQSPWTGYFCALEGDDAAVEPDYECLNDWTQHAPHDDSTTGSETWGVDLTNEDITAPMQAAIDYFINSREWEGDELSFSFEEWSGGMEVYFEDEGAVIYVVDEWVAFDSDENSDEGILMVCQSID